MIKKLKICFLVFLLIPSFGFADTSDFTISTDVVGQDTTPPTTPTLLSATATAATQIDVSWSVATDDVLLAGYVLFRDGLPVATTSLTNFADTGLSPETLYSYAVYAFDATGNISTTSNSLSTTTLALPLVITPTSTPEVSTGSFVFRLLNINIVASTNSAIFNWETSLFSRYALRWGRNDSYDEGYIVNDVYKKIHQTLVSDLEPGTSYVYELIGYTPNGTQIKLKQGEFKTESREELTPPNVQGLKAEVKGNDVLLSWSLPISILGSKIRIVRSYFGYPTDPYDGAVVFEGTGDSFFDKGALNNYSKQYYTVFVIGSDGSVSSGAVISAKRISTSPTSTSSAINPVEDLPPMEEELIDILDFGFSVENIILTQGNNSFTFNDKYIQLSNRQDFVISIPFDALPQHLKSIIVTLLDPTDQSRSYSFLLRINKDRTAYEANIAPLEVIGISRLQVEIFDYERKIIGRYRKQIEFANAPVSLNEVVFPDKIIKIVEPFFSTISLILLAIFLITYLLYRRSKKAEDKL